MPAAAPLIAAHLAPHAAVPCRACVARARRAASAAAAGGGDAAADVHAHARLRWHAAPAVPPPPPTPLPQHVPDASAAVVPAAPPPSAADVAALSDFVASHRRLLVITGAGISTESGVPDYRSPGGAYSKGHKPMTHQEFLSGHAQQQRYWARSFVGWRLFAERSPNAAHRALAAMQGAGRLHGLITQNVDRLHQAAGSRDVLELHGTTHRVVCLACGADSCRRELQAQLAALNPSFAAAARGVRGSTSDAGAGLAASPAQRPDGDVDLAAAAHESFELPACSSCGGGPLKPDVVFFGDSLPRQRAEAARSLADNADAVLVVGTSLATWSSFRLAQAAAARGAPVALLNVGPTRADGFAALRVAARAAEALPRALAHGGLDLPPLA